LGGVAEALHGVEVVIHEENLCWSGGVLFMNSHERIDAVSIIRPGEAPVEVILPENAGIAFVGENKRVRQQLVVNDGSIAHGVVVLDERDRLSGPVPH
jgi:hypothetical protein